MIQFSIKTTGQTQEYLKNVAKKLDNTRVLLARASVWMLRSVDKNFRAQGRPRKWQTLSPLTIALRRKGRKRPTETREQFEQRRAVAGIKILKDSGRLRGSITSKVFKDKAVVGTNVEYARLMQEGGRTQPKTIRIKAHRRRITQAFGRPITPRTITVGAHNIRVGSKKVPARPFLLFQKQDIKALERIGIKFVGEATK